MQNLNEIQDLIAYWTPKAESAQRATALSYLVKQAQKFIAYSRRNVIGQLIANSAQEVKQATKIVASHFGIPQRKKSEDRYDSMIRLTRAA